MIVVEGLDNTGKTTLVERIINDFPMLEQVHSIGNKHPSDEIITKQSWEAVDKDRINPLRIHDRLRFLSEYIYNPILKSRSVAFDLNELFLMLSAYLKRPQLLIYCRRPIHQIIASFDEREQLGGVAENLEDLYAAYEKVMDFLQYMFFVTGEHAGMQNGTGAYMYDFTITDYESDVKPVVQQYVRRFS